MDNGIPALPFYKDKNDIFLLKLLEYLKSLNKSQDKI